MSADYPVSDAAGSRIAPVWALLAAGALGLALVCSPLGLGKPGLLGPKAKDYPPDMRAAVEAAQASPDDPELALSTAQLLIREGRKNGDARPVRAAYTLLQPWVNEDGARWQALTQAAIAKQYLHDFTASLDLLNRSLEANPHDVEALLTRANIHLVRGELDEAALDCRHLASEERFDLAILCDTTAKALGDQAPAAYNRLEALLASDRMDRNLRGYAFSVLGEIAMFHDWPDKAKANFEKAHAEDPDNLRTRMLQADAMLNAGETEEALAALEGAADTDAILVRRAIADKKLGHNAALSDAQDILEQHFATNIRAGSAAHAREEARYYLRVKDDKALALKRAQANWGKQREYEDAWLLIESAKAAGAPDAYVPVRQWMQDQNVTAPGLTNRLKDDAGS